MPTNQEKLNALIDKLVALEQATDEIRQQMDPLVQAIALEKSKYKIGDKVKKGTMVITRITGNLNRYGDNAKVECNYYGRKILKDGVSMHSREQRLYDYGDRLV